MGMEVFTLKTDKHWRETAMPPPYPFMAGRTSTCFKGSLLWMVQISLMPFTPGFIRFNLEDESFSITPPPPLCGPRLDYTASSLAELRGELCLCVPDQRGARCRSLEMWMCADLGTNDEAPRWDRRYIIRYAPFCGVRYFRLIAMLDEEPVFQAGSDHLVLSGLQNGDGVFKDMPAPAVPEATPEPAPRQQHAPQAASQPAPRQPASEGAPRQPFVPPRTTAQDDGEGGPAFKRTRTWGYFNCGYVGEHGEEGSSNN
ncbi:hypothetical protein ACQ4PT_003411 [Festuca glaucescens]